MTANTKKETTIEADPSLPAIRMVREFDATPDRVYRAYVDPELVARWMGPRDTQMQIESWDPRTGGNYRYHAVQGGEVVASFYGSFHEVRPNERLVQTFTFEAIPDGVCLETAAFEDLGDGRTRLTTVSHAQSFEERDGMLASGMETGVVEGYEKLDELLADGAV